MSAFLWVEDFEGGQYREFAHAIFGRALGLVPADFPNEENKLREFLQARQVMLATNYVEAARFIDERLDDVDSVVLDIDLELLGEDTTEDRPVVTPLLTRWYNYDPEADNEPELYNAARDKMKPVAGYHLFLELVLNRGFPRSRILFCSNHGNHLMSIKESFEPARIEAPEILRKGDPRVGDWVDEVRTKPYLRLRRFVIDLCSEVASKMVIRENPSDELLRLHNLPGDSTAAFSQNIALEWLDAMPKHLPFNPPDGQINQLLHGFVRTATYHWDRFSADKKSREEWEGKTGKKYYSEVEIWIRASCAALKLARNTFGHSTNIDVAINENDAAFIFLLNLRTVFRMENISEHLLHQEQSLLEVGCVPSECVPSKWPSKEYLESLLRASEDDIFGRTQAANLPIKFDDGKRKRPPDMLRALQDNRSAEFEGFPMRFIRQMLWHSLLDLHYDFTKNFQIARSSSMDGIRAVAIASLEQAFPKN